MERTCRVIAIALALVFLAAVARFYHRGTGFTALIGFPQADDWEPPALRAIPHYQYPLWASYDGQFYAQRALDPLLHDATIDRGMDLAPFRARRILFSWTAYAIGLGHPSWILEVFALQNVVCWVVIAVLLTRWLPVTSWHGLGLWTACLFSHGLLWSVRFALLDGPSLMLTMVAIAAVEAKHPFWSAVTVGINTLGRETNILVAVAQPTPANRREWLHASAAAIVAVLPTLIWMDYLRSIYRSTTLAATDTFTVPGAGLVDSWRAVILSVSASTRPSDAVGPACILFSVMAQAAFVLARRRYADPWWRVACAYTVMLLLLDPVLVAPQTGAITRVMLPLTMGFNILLAAESTSTRFWPWFVAGNLHLLTVLTVLPLIPWR